MDPEAGVETRGRQQRLSIPGYAVMVRYLNPYGPRAMRGRQLAEERAAKAARKADDPPAHCQITQQSDERVCLACFRRWSPHDLVKPTCPRTGRPVE